MFYRRHSGCGTEWRICARGQAASSWLLDATGSGKTVLASYRR
jgi:hypothetical protein